MEFKEQRDMLKDAVDDYFRHGQTSALVGMYTVCAIIGYSDMCAYINGLLKQFDKIKTC